MSDSNVRAFFDSYAHDFDAIYGNRNSVANATINRLFRQAMKLRYLKTLEACAPAADRSVLDIGCGPGHYSVALAKLGTSEVLGIDFAEGMLEVARTRATNEGVAAICRFEKHDFIEYDFARKFDYTIVMGFMDYIAQPAVVIKKVLSITAIRSCFSFPLSGGFLAWQRQLRYKSRCDLYLYSEDQVRALFAACGCTMVRIERIGRDLFVTAEPANGLAPI